MRLSTSIGGGFLGACALTLVHETVKTIVPQAPRMDLLGMNALSKAMRHAGKTPPNDQKLYTMTLAGDLLSNALYYSLAGIGKPKGAITRGLLLGVTAGVGAVLLPRPLGLDDAPSSRTLETKIMTVALYTLAGLVSGAAMKWIANQRKKERQYINHPYHDTLGMETSVTYWE